MKKLMKITAVALIGAMGTSCTTTVDAYGNRRQAIDPAGAAIGAVALGALAYSVGKSRGERSANRRHSVNQSYYNQDWNRGRGNWRWEDPRFRR